MAQTRIKSTGLSANISVGNLTVSGNTTVSSLYAQSFFYSNGAVLTGTTGYTGSTGAGYTGSQGTTGYAGSQGDLGYTGSTGTGYTGSSGALGYSGSLGYTGSTGSGYTGSSGALGYSGSIGYAGSQGTAGYTGSSSGGAANIAVLNQGVTLTSSVSQINFIGNAVTATNSGSNVTVTISGTGGGGSGTGITITTSTAPPATGNVIGDQWYNTTTNTLYEYLSDGANSFWVDIQTPAVGTATTTSYVTRSYTANGTGTTYTVTSGCGVNDVLVFLNGVCQTPSTDYTISGAVLTLDAAPTTGTAIQIRELPR